MQEYYKSLGLNDGASKSEVENAYQNLRAKYAQDRFLEGEEGNLAAKRLTEVENAYKALMEEFEKQENESGGATLEKIDEMINDGKLEDAQNALDSYSDRNAEWHYLQAKVFYRRNWINESKKQVEIACNMDPSNPKYRDSFEKINAKVNENAQRFQSGNANFNDERQMGDTAADGCCSFCATWCCLNLLCNSCCR